MMFASNPAGSKYSEDLVFAPSDGSGNSIASGVITPEEKSEVNRLGKKRKYINVDELNKYAELYNAGMTYQEIMEVTGINSSSTVAKIKKAANKHNLLDHEQHQANKRKRREEKTVGKIIKAVQVQEVDKPDLPQAQAAVTATPEPADIDAMIAEMEAAARDASQMLMLTEDHRDAAAQVVRILGAERAAEIVKAIHQQLKRELAAIWRQEAV